MVSSIWMHGRKELVCDHVMIGDHDGIRHEELREVGEELKDRGRQEGDE